MDKVSGGSSAHWFSLCATDRISATPARKPSLLSIVRFPFLLVLSRIPGLMDLYRVHVHADRREHQYRVLIPHKPAKQTAAQSCPGRLQHGFLTAARPGHIDADPLSEPHTFSPFPQELSPYIVNSSRISH